MKGLGGGVDAVVTYRTALRRGSAAAARRTIQIRRVRRSGWPRRAGEDGASGTRRDVHFGTVRRALGAEAPVTTSGQAGARHGSTDPDRSAPQPPMPGEPDWAAGIRPTGEVLGTAATYETCREPADRASRGRRARRPRHERTRVHDEGRALRPGRSRDTRRAARHLVPRPAPRLVSPPGCPWQRRGRRHGHSRARRHEAAGARRLGARRVQSASDAAATSRRLFGSFDYATGPPRATSSRVLSPGCPGMRTRLRARPGSFPTNWLRCSLPLRRGRSNGRVQPAG